MLSPIRAGFPNPAEDPVERMIDLNGLIVRHPAATFALRVEGDSMEGVGIFAGDIVVVDKSLEPKNGDVVVAALDGEFTLKTFQRVAGKLRLMAANSSYQPIDPAQSSDFAIWGVVTHCVHNFRDKP